MSERPVPERTPAESPTAIGADATFGEACMLVATDGAARIIDWELARLKSIMPRVVSRTMSFSAMSCFDDALIASVQRFYGLDVDVATAETEVLEDDIERVRFFPWFLWDFRAQDEEHTVGDRFFAEGDVSDIERRVLRALCDTVVEFWEVTGKSPTGVTLEALGMGGAINVEDDVLGRELSLGQILQGRLVVVDGGLDGDGGATGLIDAIYAVLPPSTRGAIMLELASVLGGIEDVALKRKTLKAHAPELIDFAEYALEMASEPPATLNGDGETIVLCSTVVPSGGGLALEAALARGELAFELETSVAGDTIWTWRDAGNTIGFVAHDIARGRWVVGAASRERLAKLTGRLAEASIGTPALHMEETLERAATTWVETGAASWHFAVDAEVRQAFERWLAGRWIDAPHPKLGDVSPRQAASTVSNPTLQSALDGLMSHLEALVGRPLRAELGL